MSSLSKFIIGSLTAISIALAAAALVWQNRNTGLWIPYHEADSYRVLSLDPEPFDEKIPSDIPSPNTFHGYPILSEVSVTAKSSLRKVIFDLEQDSRKWKIRRAACFNPRHGIRVIKSGVVYDLLICYECHGLQFFSGEKFLENLPFAGGKSGPSADELDGMLVAKSAANLNGLTVP